MLRMAAILSITALLAGCGDLNPVKMSSTSPPPPTATVTEAVGTTTPVIYKSTETPQLTLDVPEMHCPHGCYPAVKETLEGLKGVQSVELVPQKDPDVLDDRRVVVKLNGDFNATQATEALAEAGFNDSKVEQPAAKPAAEQTVPEPPAGKEQAPEPVEAPKPVLEATN